MYILLLTIITFNAGLTATTDITIEGFDKQSDCELVLEIMEQDMADIGIITTALCVLDSTES